MAKVEFSKILKREFEVAFSKNAQPIWLRVMKYLVSGCFIYFFWDRSFFWAILVVVLMLGLSLHLWYRYKTGGWTKSYGGWDYDKNKSKLDL